ncbi:hypothetical protein CCP3SC15_410009 [Gammaproteobacteria bacterium]
MRIDGTPLLAQAQTGDKTVIAVVTRTPQIVQQLAALADQTQQPPAGVMVMDVGLEVAGQVLNASRQQRHLDLWGTRVGAGTAVLLKDLTLLFSGKRHVDKTPKGDAQWLLSGTPPHPLQISGLGCFAGTFPIMSTIKLIFCSSGYFTCEAGIWTSRPKWMHTHYVALL